MRYLIGVAAIIALLMNCGKTGAHGQVFIEMTQWGGLETPSQAKTSVLYANGTLVTPVRTSQLNPKALTDLEQVASSLLSSKLDFKQVGVISSKVPILEGGSGRIRLKVSRAGKSVAFEMTHPELFLGDSRPEMQNAARAMLVVKEAFSNSN